MQTIGGNRQGKNAFFYKIDWNGNQWGFTEEKVNAAVVQPPPHRTIPPPAAQPTNRVMWFINACVEKLKQVLGISYDPNQYNEQCLEILRAMQTLILQQSELLKNAAKKDLPPNKIQVINKLAKMFDTNYIRLVEINPKFNAIILELESGYLSKEQVQEKFCEAAAPLIETFNNNIDVILKVLPNIANETHARECLRKLSYTVVTEQQRRDAEAAEKVRPAKEEILARAKEIKFEVTLNNEQVELLGEINEINDKIDQCASFFLIGLTTEDILKLTPAEIQNRKGTTLAELSALDWHYTDFKQQFLPHATIITTTDQQLLFNTRNFFGLSQNSNDANDNNKDFPRLQNNGSDNGSDNENNTISYK